MHVQHPTLGQGAALLASLGKQARTAMHRALHIHDQSLYPWKRAHELEPRVVGQDAQGSGRGIGKRRVRGDHGGTHAGLRPMWINSGQ